MAFLDQYPVRCGHTLVIPKKHTDYIFDLNDNEYTELLLKSKEIAKILKQKLNSKRIGMTVEGFGVAHVHIHLIPINNMNEMDSTNKYCAKESELKEIVDKILGK